VFAVKVGPKVIEKRRLLSFALVNKRSQGEAGKKGDEDEGNSGREELEIGQMELQWILLSLGCCGSHRGFGPDPGVEK
jgi:hypothetical protein